MGLARVAAAAAALGSICLAGAGLGSPAASATPVTPASATPAPVTPASATPASATPASATPASVTPTSAAETPLTAEHPPGGATTIGLGGRSPGMPAWVAPQPGRRSSSPGPGAVPDVEQTLNWAGELTTGATYTAVSATWAVPAVVASRAPRDSATWVGIGGGSPQASGLIQAGTEQYTETDVTRYAAWYELYPAKSVTVVDPASGEPFPVEPGDDVSARIVEEATGTWLIELTDTTEAWHWQQTFSYLGTSRSAEWIEEAPSLTARIETLADFQSVRFTHVADVTAAPASTSLQAIEMVDQAGTVIAYPGPVETATARSVLVTFGSPPATSAGTTLTTTTGTPTRPAAPTAALGYDLVGADGGVFTFGDAPFLGSLPGIRVVPSKPISGIAVAGGGKGYYLVGADGGVFAFGDAPFLGSLPGIHVVPNQPIIGIVTDVTGRGYFLVGRDGGVFAFGDARFAGSLPSEGIPVDDIVGMAATPSGSGYWLLASTGEVYALGAAQDYGTALGSPSPATAITAAATGGGYWISTADGEVFSFGHARQYGTAPAVGITPSQPIVAIVPTAGTGGYWLVGADGGVFSFGDAPFLGSLPAIGVRVSDVVGAASVAG